MTIKELLRHQHHTGHLCLIRQGLFFRGYNRAASMLHDLMGYQVKTKEVLSCGEKLFYVGFPAEKNIVEQVAEFDLTNSTPMECMNFIARLQQLYEQRRE